MTIKHTICESSRDSVMIVVDCHGKEISDKINEALANKHLNVQINSGSRKRRFKTFQ